MNAFKCDGFLFFEFQKNLLNKINGYKPLSY